MGRDEDLVALADAERLEREQDAGGAARHPDRVVGPAEVREGRLEGGTLLAFDVATAPEDVGGSLDDVVVDVNVRERDLFHIS